MYAKNYFVYKSTMSEGMAIHGNYSEFQSFAGTQMLFCSYCHLEKWEFNNLSAPFWRWYFNDSPGAFIRVNKTHIALTPDQVILIPPHTAFASRTQRLVGHLYIHFALGLDRTAQPGQIYTHSPDPEEGRLIKRMIHVMKDVRPGTELEISFLSQALVNLALASVPSVAWDGRIPDSRIEQAVRSIKARFPLAAGNAILAREAHMNVNAFTRHFRLATGYAPHQYLLRLRIEKATQLLQHSTTSLETIAEQVGFCDRFHFSRIFKQQVKISPSAFRRGSREE